MVEFFNTLEMRVQRSELKDEEVLFPAEDRGPVDRMVDWTCTNMKHAHEVAADHLVDRTEEGNRSKSIGRPTETVRSY